MGKIHFSQFALPDLRATEYPFGMADDLDDLPEFHPQTVIRDWGSGQAFHLSDALTGVSVFGATGSGKTSGPAKHLAYGYLAAGFGGLVLCAKKEERRQWEKWAAECDRTDDLIIVDSSGKRRFNFMDWEASRPGEGGGFTINIVALLDEIAKAVSGNSGKAGGDYKFWEDALHNLLSNLVDLPVLAGLEVSLPILRSIVSSAATTPAQAIDPQWREKSADKTRSSILLNFSVLIRPLVTRPLRKLFSSDTNVKPEDAFEGKIIVVDLPVQDFKLVGRIASLAWKYCFQVAVLRRTPPTRPDTFLRPVFLWADEAHIFVSEFDSEYQAVARSAGGCTVYLTQNIESYRRVLGNNDAVDSLLGNLQAKFFCQNSGDTNEWAAKLLGERYVDITSTNVGRSGTEGQSSSSGISRSEQRRYFVEPSRFTTLKRGGVHHGFQVEAIVYNGGHRFPTGAPGREESLPYKLITFNQK
jgi:hypothetical protein